jgi:hypothetical protein
MRATTKYNGCEAMERIGADKIRELLPKVDAEVFSPEVFDQTGVFVVRKAIAADTICLWQSAWADFYASELSSGRNVDKFNPVALRESLPPVLAAIHQHTSLLDIAEQAFGPDIGLYNQRFVIKDQYSRDSVFLHHDSPYHRGWPNKASAFVPLSQVTPENGGFVFYPGTHQFGYLGDAGEINHDILDPAWPTISPSLQPGDVALMNSLTWHRSGPHISGPDRILADIIYQPANDPSSNALLRGEWRTEIFLNQSSLANRDIFRRSRTSRLTELQMRLDQLETERKDLS